MPDSARWWGDETGQIIELKAELHDGFAHIPIGFGSTVAVTNGIVRGNSWLAAIVYGLPAIVFSSLADLVSIGRTVTAILSVVLVGFLFYAMRAFGVDRLLALFATLLLISTRSFFFASHAARLDVAAGLALVGCVFYLSQVFERWTLASCQPSARWFFLLGAGMLLLATLSIHLLTLLAPIGLLALYHFGAFKHLSHLGAAVGGVLAVAAVLFAIYVISGAPITLFGTTVLHTQFHSVIDEIPITKLISPNAQIGNLLERWEGFIAEAPAMFVLLVVAVAVCILRFKHHALTLSERFAVQACVLAVLSWLLFESYAMYYYMQVLPLIALVLTFVISRAVPRLILKSETRLALSFGAIVIFYFGIADASRAGTSGARITGVNEQALRHTMQNMINPRGVILAQNPALAWLLYHTELTVMSPHFLEFPLNERADVEVMRGEQVAYVLSYTESGQSNYSFEVTPMKHVTDSLGELIATEHGRLLDVNRNYFALDSTRIDTLKLYKLHW